MNPTQNAPQPPHSFDNDYLRDAVDRLLSSEDPLHILQAGHPVLRTPALPFTGQIALPAMERLIARMRQTMQDAPGVGLAAPQLGIPLQLAVIEDNFIVPEDTALMRDRRPLDFLTIVNPRYTPVGTTRAAHYEGCLSVSGWQAVVDRLATVDVDYQDEHGRTCQRRFHGWQARILQHEIDHLSGTLYLDTAYMRSLTSHEEYARHWTAPGIDDARTALKF